MWIEMAESVSRASSDFLALWNRDPALIVVIRLQLPLFAQMAIVSGFGICLFAGAIWTERSVAAERINLALIGYAAGWLWFPPFIGVTVLDAGLLAFVLVGLLMTTINAVRSLPASNR